MRAPTVLLLTLGCLAPALAQEGGPAPATAEPESALPSPDPPPASEIATVTTAAPAPPPSAPAQGEAAKGKLLDEIVVTARRREENLQEVPIAISVLDEEALLKQNISGPNDLGQASPGLSTVNNNQRNSTAYSIRGKGEAFANSPAGVVPYTAEAPDLSAFFYDLSSIQVLKGPQGTLFGRNTTGGAILLTPKKPTEEFEGYVMVRGGNYKRFDGEFAAGGPIIDDMLSVRIAGQRLRRQGYTENLSDGKHLDDEHRESYRGSIVLKPVDALENYLLFQHDHYDENGSANVIVTYLNEPLTPHRAELGPYIEEQKRRGPRKVEHNGIDRNEYAQWGLVNNTTFHLNDAWSLKNIYRYSKGDDAAMANNIDTDGSPFRLLESRIVERGDIVRESDEFQVQFDDPEGLSAVAGYFHEAADHDQAVVAADFSLPSAADFVPWSAIVRLQPKDRSQAAFAQTSWQFVEDWTITLGFRRTWDVRKTGFGINVIAAGSPEVPLTPYQNFRTESTENNWNIALDHRLTDDVLLYGSVRRGYKGGGFNISPNVERISYDPEFVTSYELGAKNEWTLAGVPVRANVDVFYDDYTDIQRLISSQEIIPGLVVVNAAKATVKGLDVDLLAIPSGFFDATLQYTYLDCAYDKYDDPEFGDLSKSKFVNAPKHQVMFTPAVHFALPGTWGTLSAQTPIYYQTKYAIHPNNTKNGNESNDVAVASSTKPGYARFDLRIDWRDILGKRLSAGFYIRNLTDEVYEVGGINQLSNPLSGFGATMYGAPRTIALEVRYDFGG